MYLDAVMDWDKNGDVIVKTPDEQIGENIALSILAFGKTLFGNGMTRKEAQKSMPIPSYQDARDFFTTADKEVMDRH